MPFFPVPVPFSIPHWFSILSNLSYYLTGYDSMIPMIPVFVWLGYCYSTDLDYLQIWCSIDSNVTLFPGLRIIFIITWFSFFCKLLVFLMCTDVLLSEVYQKLKDKTKKVSYLFINIWICMLCWYINILSCLVLFCLVLSFTTSILLQVKFLNVQTHSHCHQIQTLLKKPLNLYPSIRWS